MPTLSRMKAEALLRTARAARPLYDDLRPAYTRLDPLVALLRRRGFTGLMYAAGRPGEGVVWFDHGRLHSGWLLLPEARDGGIPRCTPPRRRSLPMPSTPRLRQGRPDLPRRRHRPSL